MVSEGNRFRFYPFFDVTLKVCINMEDMSVRLLQYKHYFLKSLDVNCHVFEKPFGCNTKFLMTNSTDIINGQMNQQGAQLLTYNLYLLFLLCTTSFGRTIRTSTQQLDSPAQMYQMRDTVNQMVLLMMYGWFVRNLQCKARKVNKDYT